MFSMLAALPRPKYQSIIVCDKQTVKDIAGLIVYGIKQSLPQAVKIAKNFKGRNDEETCSNVWHYLKKNINYKAEPSDLQTVKTLSRLLVSDKQGDCKHLTTACACLLMCLGFKIKLRMVSFNYYSKEPKHIYCIATKNGKSYIMDVVMPRYGHEPIYKHKKDIKLN